MRTFTGRLAQRQTKVPPAKFGSVGFTPPPVAGGSFTWSAIVSSFVLSVDHDAPNRLAFVHQIETLIDLFKFQFVRDHWINLNFSRHVPIDDFRHVGASTRAAEGRTFPDTSRDKLERPGRYFLARAGNADDNR